jgi:hypothetical protein
MSAEAHMPRPAALRVLSALLQLAGGSGSVCASYSEIGQAAGRSRSVVSAGIGELLAGGWITQRKSFGGRASYTFTNAAISQAASTSAYSRQPHSRPVVQSSSSSVVQSFSSSVVHPPTDLVLGTSGGGGTRSGDFSEIPESANGAPSVQEPAESEAIQRARRLLQEYNVGEPTQTELARALAPRFGAEEPTVRRICERTVDDWRRGWAKNPIGLTVNRLRRFVAGEQLSFLVELGQPEARPPAGSQSKRGRRGGTFQRPQVSYTAEQRAAVEERARRELELEEQAT